eukprot:6550943-Pyramimonas_sp.AAC.1
MAADAGARPTPKGSKFAVIALGLGNFEKNPRCSGSSMLREYIRRRHRSSHDMTTRGHDAHAIIHALIAANENMAGYDRPVLVDTRALKDPTHTCSIGHHPNILRNSVENEHFAGIAECVGKALARNKSSKFVCIVAICRSGRHRSVAVSYGAGQFLKQHDNAVLRA